MAINVDATLGDLVIEDPRRSKVFEEFGIDFCCNGHRPLSDAVLEAELELAAVAAALDLPAAPAGSEISIPRENAALAHDIVDTHHAYMWQKMPELHALVNKVRDVHGDRHPELIQVADLYAQAVAELDPHMTKEERVVFPAISRLEKTGGGAAVEGSLAGPIAELRREHDELGELLKQLRETTKGYAVPEDACTSYRMMLAGLEEMEHDLHEHIHKENNILFPQVLALEERA